MTAVAVGKGRAGIYAAILEQRRAAEEEWVRSHRVLELLPQGVDHAITQFSDFKPYPWVSMAAPDMVGALRILVEFIREGWGIENIESRGQDGGIRYVNPIRFWLDHKPTSDETPVHWAVDEGIVVRLESAPHGSTQEVQCWMLAPGFGTPLIRVCIRVDAYPGRRPYILREFDPRNHRSRGKKIYPDLGDSIKVQWWATEGSICGGYYFEFDQFADWISHNEEGVES